MFGMETPFLLIGLAVVIGALGGGAIVTKAFRIRGRNKDDSKA